MSKNENQPLVSICMPLYNTEDFIGETIRKLKEQTYQNIEVIIVNDHSTDNSVDIVKSFNWDRIKLFTNPKKGACSARNYAFEKSTGEYIKFLDADDYCTSKMIERQVETILKKGKKSVIFSPLKLLFQDGNFLKPKRSIDHDYDIAFDLQVEIMKFGGTNIPYCYIMSRELVEASGGWDETVLKNQDGEYFSRVLAQADKAFSVSDEFVIYRKTGTGLSTKLSLKAVNSVLETHRKVIVLSIKKNDTEEMRQICGKYLGFFVFVYYLELKELLDRVYEITKEFNLPLLFPERKVFKLLRVFLGWKNSIAIMHKMGLINNPN